MRYPYHRWAGGTASWSSRRTKCCVPLAMTSSVLRSLDHLKGSEDLLKDP